MPWILLNFPAAESEVDFQLRFSAPVRLPTVNHINPPPMHHVRLRIAACAENFQPRDTVATETRDFDGRFWSLNAKAAVGFITKVG